MAGKLTAKQAKFVTEYLVDLNATAAAGRAGYSDPNIGRQLITKPNVAEAIESAQKDREARTLITQDAVLARLWAEATLTEDKGGTQSGRVSALNIVAKHLGMLTDRLAVETVETVEWVIQVVDEKPALPAPQAT